MPRWDLAALEEHGACGEHRSGAQAAALQHGRAHAHQRAALHDAALELRRVADRCVLLDHGREIFGAVDDHVVLHVGTHADGDLRFVAPQHGAEPYARAGFDLDITDEDGGGCDVRVAVHLRALAAELEFHWPL